MSNILQGKEEYFTLIQKYSHYQPVDRMIEYNQIKGKGGERAVSEYVLELKGITKIFPGVKALNNVQFQLKPGEVHALMGEKCRLNSKRSFGRTTNHLQDRQQPLLLFP